MLFTTLTLQKAVKVTQVNFHSAAITFEAKQLSLVNFFFPITIQFRHSKESQTPASKREEGKKVKKEQEQKAEKEKTLRASPNN